MSHVSLTLPAPTLPETNPSASEWEPMASPEVGPCGLPLDPLDSETIQAWEAEVAEPLSDNSPSCDPLFIGEPLTQKVAVADFVSPLIGGAGQAELSGFEDDDDVGGGEGLPPDDEEDEFDDFDDIDEDDFDDDFDDDFEEELDDDYEIEIEDEISAEFGLSGVEVDIDEIEDIDALDADVDADIELDPGLDLDDKE